MYTGDLFLGDLIGELGRRFFWWFNLKSTSTRFDIKTTQC